MKTHTLVIFKMEGRGKEASPVAFFPEKPGTVLSPYPCLCYSFGHGQADTTYAARLKPATQEQYAPLLRELERIGYTDLKPVRKFLSSHLETRKAALKNP
jgi:hypothetical protein